MSADDTSAAVEAAALAYDDDLARLAAAFERDEREAFDRARAEALQALDDELADEARFEAEMLADDDRRGI